MYNKNMKKVTYGVLTGLILSLSLTGCGDGTEESVTESSSVEPADGMPQPVQIDMSQVEAQNPVTGNDNAVHLLCQSGNLTAEEEAAVQKELESMLLNLEVEDYLGEGIHMISSEEWFESLSVGLCEGFRSYALVQSGETLLSVQIGYDVDGKAFSNVSYLAGENGLVLLKQGDNKTSLLQTGISDRAYNGEYESWIFNGTTGEIVWEKGTYSGGVPVGEYSISTGYLPAGEVFDLWANRETVSYEIKTITYDEQGNPVETPQPTASPAATKAPSATKAPQEDEDEDDNNDNNDNGGSDNGGDSGPTTGDTDLDWSPDLM